MPKPRTTNRFAALVLGLLAAGAALSAGAVWPQEPVAAADAESAAASAPGADPIDGEIGIGEVVRGQTGYGLSVFAGSEPERFGVEVVGVIREMDPGTSYIVARLSGAGLEESGVVAGMSGSPVYLDDRLAGAVAYSWSFTTEALALVTPIAAMRELSALESGAAAGESLGLAVTGGVSGGALARERSASRSFDRAVRQLLEPPDAPEAVAAAVRKTIAEQLGALAAPAERAMPGGAQITTLGFGEPLRRMLAAAPAGRAEGMPDLAAGSAVAGVLIDGDLKLAVSGTATRVDGGEVLAMGHPYLGVGPLQVPMATVEVIGVVSRQSISMRLSNIGSVVGAFDQDRFAGLRGRVGAEARTIPMTIRVEAPNGDLRRFDLRLADLPMMLPALVAIPTMQALDAASYGGGESGLDMTGVLHLKGHEAVPLHQTFDGTGPGTGAAFHLLALVGALVHSDHEDVEIESVDLALTQTHGVRVASIERAQPSAWRVHAGDTVEVVFDLRRHRGDRYQETLDVAIPEDSRPGRHYLFVGDGESVDAARLKLEPAKALSLDEELDLLRSFQPKSRLAALGVVPARGLIVEGRPMPQLPASMRSIWRASPLQGEPRRLNLAIVSEHGRDLDVPLDGLFRLDLEILPGTAP